MKRNFILITSSGQTFDDEGNSVENEQVLDYLNADDIFQVQEIVEKNMAEKKYGDFQDYKIVEIRNLCHKNGVYMLLIVPANSDFDYPTIDETDVSCYDDKRTVLIKAIESIEYELIKTEEIEKDLDNLKFSSIVAEVLSLDKYSDLRTRLDYLSDKDLESVYRELFDIQFDKNVSNHTEIRVEGETIYDRIF